MKVLIWIGCFFAMVLIRVIFQYMGIILGGIPTMLLFGLAWWGASRLCKVWDDRKKYK